MVPFVLSKSRSVDMKHDEAKLDVAVSALSTCGTYGDAFQH